MSVEFSKLELFSIILPLFFLPGSDTLQQRRFESRVAAHKNGAAQKVVVWFWAV